MNFTVDTDWGVGVLFPKADYLYFSGTTYIWEYFDKYRNDILNLISIDEFNERYPV